MCASALTRTSAQPVSQQSVATPGARSVRSTASSSFPISSSSAPARGGAEALVTGATRLRHPGAARKRSARAGPGRDPDTSALALERWSTKRLDAPVDLSRRGRQASVPGVVHGSRPGPARALSGTRGAGMTALCAVPARGTAEFVTREAVIFGLQPPSGDPPLAVWQRRLQMPRSAPQQMATAATLAALVIQSRIAELPQTC